MKAEKIDKVMMFEKLDKYLNDGKPVPIIQNYPGI